MKLNIQEYFAKYKLEKDKLEAYGFQNGIYVTNILNDSIRLTFSLENETMFLEAYDLDLEEPCFSFNTSFTIKEKWLYIIEDMKEKCYEKVLYLSKEANIINDYIIHKYDIHPEFLFEEEDIGVYRRSDNKKWFGVIMQIDCSKLDKSKSGQVNILNLKVNNAEQLTDGRWIYKAYHMNKKYWISVLLSGNDSLETVYGLIEESYQNVFKEK